MFVANRLPIKNQIPFLIASGGFTVDDMNMDMSRSIADRKILFLKTFESLAKIPGLSYVKRSPTAIFRWFGIDVIGRPRIERSVKGIDLILIFLARLAGPIDIGIPFCSFCFMATT